MAKSSAGGEQLALAIEPALESRPLSLLRPMQPTPGVAPFDDEGWFFEPWWPGTPALVHVDGGRVQLHSEHLADATQAFPELSGIAGQFAFDRLILQATLLVLDADGRPDAELLRRRLGQPDDTTGTPALVCSDLLRCDDSVLMDLPFDERRRRLTEALRDGDRCVVSRGLLGEGTTLAQAAAQMGLTEIGARQLSGRYRPGAVSDDWLRLPVTEAPAPTRRPLLALLQRLPL